MKINLFNLEITIERKGSYVERILRDMNKEIPADRRGLDAKIARIKWLRAHGKYFPKGTIDFHNDTPALVACKEWVEKYYN